MPIAPLILPSLRRDGFHAWGAAILGKKGGMIVGT